MLTQTDASIRLGIIVDENSLQQGQLKLQQQNGSIVLSFYPEIGCNPNNRAKRFSTVPDYVFNLGDFMMIKVNSKDKQNVIIEGPRSKIQLVLTNDEDYSKLFRFISSYVKLFHTECNPNVFLFIPYDLGTFPDPNSVNDNQTRIDSSFFDDIFYAHSYSSPILPPMKPHSSFSVFNPNDHPNLLLEYPSEEVHFSREDFEKLFDDEGKIESHDFPFILYNKSVDQTILHEIWEFLLFPSFKTLTREERHNKKMENYSIYKQTKKIWKTTTLSQWKNFDEMRDLVERIEQDLDKHSQLFSQYSHPECVQKIAFDILMTLSFWKWDTAMYVDNMIVFLFPFIFSFIKEATIDSITPINPNYEFEDMESIESEIFWCFDSFFENNHINELIHPIKNPLIYSFINDAGEIISSTFPSIRSILDQKHVFSLDFIVDDFSFWFAKVFVENDQLVKLWISCLSCSSTTLFFKTFILAIIYTLMPEIEKLCVLSSKEFEIKFEKLKKENLNLPLFLYNAKVLQEMLTDKS